MATELVDEIITRLSSQGVGGTTSTATWRLVARQFLPGTLGASTQAQQIAVVPTGGLPWEPAAGFDRPRFQLLFRGKRDGSTGLEAKVSAAITALCSSSVAGYDVGTRTYIDVQKVGDPIWLGRDAADRPLYSQNFQAWRNRTT